MKQLLTIILLALSLTSTKAATLTASDRIGGSSLWELTLGDPTILVGPMFDYVWTPPGSSITFGTTTATGPGWVVFEYDTALNLTANYFSPGYAVTIPDGTALRTAIINSNNSQTTFSDICKAVKYWQRLGGCTAGLCDGPGNKPCK